MPNKIKVRRGTDAQRQGATTLDNYEVHYSTGNSSNGRPERLWVADSAAGAHANSGDVLIGPYEFLSGDSRIGVTTDYATGRVIISYVDAATFGPSRSITQVASTYSNNSTIEVGDVFGGPHSLTVGVGGGANEVKPDRAGYTYSGSTAYFASPLNAIDGTLLNSGTQSLSWSQSISAPANFSLSGSRNVPVTLFVDPPAASGFSQVSSNFNFAFGWRVRGFISTTLYTPVLLPTAANITSTSGSNISRFNAVQQTPTSTTQRDYLLPNDGQQWHAYLVHTCSPDASGDLYGWTPSATVVGSGAISLTEVTAITAGDYVEGNIGGQATTKYYRVWRFGGTTGFFGDGSTLSFNIS